MTMRYAEELMAAAPRHASVTRVRVGVSRDGLIAGDGRPCHLQRRGLWRLPSVCQLRRPHRYQLPHTSHPSRRARLYQPGAGWQRAAPGGPQFTSLWSRCWIQAREMGIDPFAFRRQNLLQGGEASPFGDHWLDVRATEPWTWLRRLHRPVVPQGRAIYSSF